MVDAETLASFFLIINRFIFYPEKQVSGLEVLIPDRVNHCQNNQAKEDRMAIQARLIITPTFIISRCLTCPEPNTMAFGGVATGNMKAHDAEIPISADRISGGTPSTSAIEAKIGTSSAALAVLLANSVRNTTKATTSSRTMNNPACSRKPLRPWARNYTGTGFF